jgi:small subunit ribosomal protein S6
MPQYELMYIVSSNVSDDQIPTVTDGVLKFITDLGGNVLKEEKLGKKKLAYPIAKTRNGFYDVVNFEMEASKLAELDLKVRTAEGVIRHLVINLEETLRRMAKDAEAQEKMNKNRAANAKNQKTDIGSEQQDLDQKIEQALGDEVTTA